MKRTLEMLGLARKLAAKLQLEGPGFPQDSNFTGLVSVPQQTYAPVQMPVQDPLSIWEPSNTNGTELRPIKNKMTTASSLVIQMTEILANQVDAFKDEVLKWSVNPKNFYSNEPMQYRYAISVIKSLAMLVDEIDSTARISSVSEAPDFLDPERFLKFIKYIQDNLSYLQKSGMLFSKLKSFLPVYNGLHNLERVLNTGMGTISKPEYSSYDMWAKQDAEEDAVTESEERMKNLPKPQEPEPATFHDGPPTELSLKTNLK